MSFTSWLKSGPWPLDGAMGSELEERGYDLSRELWSATMLVEDPEAIAQVHRDYVDAGARVLLSASYQASRFGFEQVGRTGTEADQQMVASLKLARAEASRSSEKVWVAASVGPYGAVLGGGQEYVGNYGLSHTALVDFHKERLEVLASASPDVFACETVPDLREVAALQEALAEFSHIPAWISMSCHDASSTCAGQPFSELASMVSGNNQVVAIGVNCTKPEYVSDLLTAISGWGPLVVYPNAGRVWDGENRVWLGDGEMTLPPHAVAEWVSLGASLIGGCCGLGPSAIRSISQQLKDFRHAS